MLEKPDLQDEKLIACLRDEYGVLARQVTFLPLGADLNTSVYRVVARDEAVYFAKLRSGAFDEIIVALPKFLSDQGVGPIIAPLATQTGQLWTRVDAFTLILYPFIEGDNGYAVPLSDRHWQVFGAALKRLHTTAMPPAIRQRIPQETYPPQGRASVKRFVAQVEHERFADPIASELAIALQAKRAEILDLVGRTERLARDLQARTPEFVVCHSDLHAGNILIDTNGMLYIVDWDNPILACKERDLMYAGGGQGFSGHTTQEEETLFYQGYGQTQIDQIALAYYRYERIVQDIAVECEHIFLTTGNDEDRAQSLHYFKSNFLPNGVLAVAYNADKSAE